MHVAGRIAERRRNAASQPASMTHAAMTAEAHVRAGIGEYLLRCPVGLEDPRDLGHDLLAALDRARVRPVSEPAEEGAYAVK